MNWFHFESTWAPCKLIVMSNNPININIIEDNILYSTMIDKGKCKIQLMKNICDFSSFMCDYLYFPSCIFSCDSIGEYIFGNNINHTHFFCLIKTRSKQKPTTTLNFHWFQWVELLKEKLYVRDVHCWIEHIDHQCNRSKLQRFTDALGNCSSSWSQQSGDECDCEWKGS